MQNLALLAIGTGLLATLFWGVSDFFAAKASKKFSGLVAVFYVSLVATTTYTLFYVLFLQGHLLFDLKAIIYAMLAGAIFTLALASFYKGLDIGPVSIVSPLGSVYPLVTTILLVVIFGDRLSSLQITGIIVVIGGVLAASGLFEQNKQPLSAGLLWSLLAALCWGINFALLAEAIRTIGWQFATLIQSLTSTLVFILAAPVIVGKKQLISLKMTPFKNVFLLGAGLLQILGFLAVTMGIGLVDNLASIVLATSACYPVITVFLSLRHFKEKVKPIPLAGALISVAGVVILSLGS